MEKLEEKKNIVSYSAAASEVFAIVTFAMATHHSHEIY